MPKDGKHTVPVRTFEQGYLKYLEAYTYECLPGYHTEDAMVTICQHDGSLSLTTPPECYGES